jgi:hypothetical protein
MALNNRGKVLQIVYLLLVFGALAGLLALLAGRGY